MNDEFNKFILAARRVSAKMHPSRKWEPLKMIDTRQEPDHVYEHWQSPLYVVSVRRYPQGSKLQPLNQQSAYTYIGIALVDGGARHDWRDLQKIKNQLVGEEWEAVELYPAESRLMDPSNLFILWAYPAVPIGMYEGRRIAGPNTCLAPQRPWPASEMPLEVLPESKE